MGGVHEWDGSPLADSVDWTTQGAVTPIKDQGQCGSCWTWGTTGSLEGAWQLASGQLTAMSEQQFVDCDHNGDQGCNGGLMDNAFEWAQNQAICSEASYPHKAVGGTCKTSCTTVIPKGGVTGHIDVAPSEPALMSALNSQPVSIATATKAATAVSQTMLSSGLRTRPFAPRVLTHTRQLLELARHFAPQSSRRVVSLNTLTWRHPNPP